MAENDKRKSNEDTVTINAKVTLKKDEYEKYKSGEIKSNKGLRGDDGKLSSIPDFVEVNEETHSEKPQRYAEHEAHGLADVIIEKVVVPVVGELTEKAVDVVVDNAVKAVAYVWNNAVVPNAKKGANVVSAKVKEIKTNYQIKKQQEQTAIAVSKQAVKTAEKAKQSERAVEHTSEEVDMILREMRNAAIVFAAGIRELSRTIVVNSIDPDKAIELQKNIERLSSAEAMSVINYMLEDKNSELLDEASRRILAEFRNRNLIVDNEVVPISKFLP